MRLTCVGLRGIVLRRVEPGEKFLGCEYEGTIEPGSGVRQGFAEAGFFLKFAHFEDFAAVEAFHILRVIILSDELSSLVLAGRIGC